jgi:beta-glucosidase/6-phospho-beta-glucosidase/beta-galactosidase
MLRRSPRAALLLLAACTPGAQASTDPTGTDAETSAGVPTSTAPSPTDTTAPPDTTASEPTTTGGPAPQFPAIGPIAGPGGRDSFRFGAASAATQIEDQNPAVDWYVWTAPPPGGLGNGTFVGDAARGYSLALADVALLQELHLDSYRFSVEWARVEPARDVIDEAALAHYDALLDALVAAGIRPLITLHHFSNPTWIEDPRATDCDGGPTDTNLCGWDHEAGGPEVVAEFAAHAALLAARFGDRVDEWATVNEPINYLLGAYGQGNFPPGQAGLFAPPDEILIPAARNYIRGHVAAYDAVHAADVVDADGDGQPAAVGFTHAVGEWIPARDNHISDDPADIAARDRLVHVYHLLFVEALREGGFDSDFDGSLDEPQPAWRGKLDWLGVQYYFRAGVTGEPGLMPKIAATPCFGEIDFGACVPPLDPTWVVPAMNYEHDAKGLYNRLVEFAARWPDLPLVVTESGIATEVGARRAEAVVRALEWIARARDEGVDVRGYYHWSLFDNFEWALGFTPRFGLYRVDYATYAREPTEAATVLGDIAREREIGDARAARYGGEGPMTPEP